MNRKRSHAPAFAMWLLQHFCPGDKESLTGDLLESLREGKSERWFLRQVLIAIAAGMLMELRRRWPHICYATLATVLFGLFGWAIFGSSWMVLRIWTRELPWPLSNGFLFGQTPVLGLMVLPVLLGLMLWTRSFSWIGIGRVYGLSVVLLAVGDLTTSLWVGSHGNERAWPLAAYGVLRIFLTLLISAWAGWRLPPSIASARIVSD